MPTTIHTTWHVWPDFIQSFLENFDGLFEEITKLEELEYFNLYQIPSRPGQIRTVERWTEDPYWVTTVSIYQYLPAFYELTSVKTLWEKPFYKRFRQVMDKCATDDILTENSELHVQFLVPEPGFQYINPLAWRQAKETDYPTSVIL
jgi:hypothetical protein